MVVVGLLIYCVPQCNEKVAVATISQPPPAPTRELKPSVRAPEPPKPKTVLEQMREIEDIDTAVALARPSMGDTSGGPSKGAAFLGMWFLAHGVDQKALAKLPATARGKVLKDSAAELGRRICTSGRILEIAAEHTDSGTVYSGGMMSNFEVTRFMAIGDTGELVEGSRARFCGVVTGIENYPNSAGGVTHAVALVGGFDLRKRESSDEYGEIEIGY